MNSHTMNNHTGPSSRFLTGLAAPLALTSALHAGVPVMSFVPLEFPVRKDWQAMELEFRLSEPAPAGGAYVDYRMGAVPGRPVAVLEDDFHLRPQAGATGMPKRPGRIYFPPGETSFIQRVYAVEDDVEEPLKWARLVFGEPVGMTLAPGLTAEFSVESNFKERFYAAHLHNPGVTTDIRIRGFDLQVDRFDPTLVRMGSGMSDFYVLGEDWGKHPSVAVADFIPGDGRWEYIVGSGEGVPGRFAVFTKTITGEAQKRLEIVPHALPNGQAFTGGMWLAAADFNNDGVPDIVTVPRVNPVFGSPGTDAKVQIWDVWRSVRNDGGNSSWRIWERTLAAPVPGIGQTAGFHVTAGDVTGDGVNDVIIGNGPGLPPLVQIWAYTGNFQTDASGFNRTHLFPVFNMEMNKGIYVGTSDYNSDGRLDLIAGSGSTLRVRNWVLPPGQNGDEWADRAWDGIHHVKVQDINSGTVLFDRQMGDLNGNGIIDEHEGSDDASDDTFVFGGKGFAGFMRPDSFIASRFDFDPQWVQNIPLGRAYTLLPGTGNTGLVSRMSHVPWAGSDQVRLRQIVRGLPMTTPAPPRHVPNGILTDDAPVLRSITPETRGGVPGQLVRFHYTDYNGYLPVMEVSDDMLSWQEVDPRTVEWDPGSTNVQSLFIPAAEIAVKQKRFYRLRFINLDATF